MCYIKSFVLVLPTFHRAKQLARFQVVPLNELWVLHGVRERQEEIKSNTGYSVDPVGPQHQSDRVELSKPRGSQECGIVCRSSHLWDFPKHLLYCSNESNFNFLLEVGPDLAQSNRILDWVMLISPRRNIITSRTYLDSSSSSIRF